MKWVTITRRLNGWFFSYLQVIVNLTTGIRLLFFSFKVLAVVVALV